MYSQYTRCFQQIGILELEKIIDVAIKNPHEGLQGTVGIKLSIINI